MNRDDARALTVKLVYAYPSSKVDEPVAALFIDEMEQLDSADVATVAVTNIIRGEVFFPNIATLRSYYAEAKRSVGKKSPPYEWRAKEPVPEWVHVWYWAHNTQGEDREFPQCSEVEPVSLDKVMLDEGWHHVLERFGSVIDNLGTGPGLPKMSWEDYEQWRLKWQDAGAPLTTETSVVVSGLKRASG